MGFNADKVALRHEAWPSTEYDRCAALERGFWKRHPQIRRASMVASTMQAIVYKICDYLQVPNAPKVTITRNMPGQWGGYFYHSYCKWGRSGYICLRPFNAKIDSLLHELTHFIVFHEDIATKDTTPQTFGFTGGNFTHIAAKPATSLNHGAGFCEWEQLVFDTWLACGGPYLVHE